MKLMICVPTAEMARQAIFYDHFDNIRKPEGTVIMRPHGQSPAAGRNAVIKVAVENGFSHVLFVDDDTIPPVDLFEKLVRHDKDMVTGLYLMRNSPHKPILFSETNDKGHCLNYDMDDKIHDELVEVVNAGLGAVLIKTEVFKAMPAPWITLGELDPENWCDDIAFFNRARKLGFKLYCDLTVRCGHMATLIVTPEYYEGKWQVSYETFGTQKFMHIMPRVRELVNA